MTPAVRALDAARIAYALHEYAAVGSADYARAAAQALGVPIDRVFKTLIARRGDSGELMAALVPANCSLDLKKLAHLAGCRKAGMADPSEAERSTGYVLGGISPFGQRRRLPTFVDASIGVGGKRSLYVSGGRRGLEIELDPDDLVTQTQATVAVIAR